MLFFFIFVNQIVFGLTDAVVRLEMFAEVDKEVFTLINLTAYIITYAVNMISTRKPISNFLWINRERLILIDILVYGVISAVTPYTQELRFILLGTAGILCSQIMLLIWESFKEKKGQGMALQARKESSESLGWILGSLSYLSLVFLGYELSLSEAILYQYVTVLAEGTALILATRKV